jgi:hypothetical protein
MTTSNSSDTPHTVPLEWMDAAKACEAFYAGIDQQEMQGIHRTATMRIKEVAAIIARHSPHWVSGDGSCDYCGKVPSIAMPTSFCDECSEKAMKWAASGWVKIEEGKPETPKVEVIECHHCRRIAISVDDLRIHTYGKNSHGGSKCAGAWEIVLSTAPPTEGETRK